MWTEVTANDFCASVRDGTHDSPKPVEKGRYLITSRHIIGGKIDLSNAYLISNDDFDAINKRSKVDRWDVLISMIGTVGEPCLVKDEPEFAIKNIGLFKTKNELDGRWLYYYLTSPQAQTLIRQHSRGTTQAYVPLGALREFPIRVPKDREVMHAVTNILSGLDEKIDLNRRINQTLEAMAQAIFKSWFVDFDPIKAKIAAIEQGQDPLRAAMRAISGKTDAELDQVPREHHNQLAATAALFPDEMEESELGEIPKRWDVKRIGDMIELAYGKALKSTDRQKGYVPVYGSGGITGYHNEALVPHGAIIVGRKGTVGSLYWEDKPFFPIDTTFYVKPKVLPMTYCFYAMQTLGLDKMNTDAAVPGLNRENVYRLELVKPPTSVLNAFDGLIGQTRKAMRANEVASQSLAELRDSLLPKLLSGELAIDKMAGLVDTTGAI
ncbi:restriction endonuclease subunit S [Serratia marcescens]|uniref:restriction endonuclease subunit S n=1 Tax=Serratia marcescens TaxID=615 RepID=UPI001EF523D7|nr:restriction endonuclease subunit S [Serratia marcescens]EKX2167768.1 restriction endonuclease subunit S [Serratia marcescens]MDM1838655.1 restriction endonuclease subunit S [Serratia marcescens]MDM1848824.1 restriction endonuclease subunit S [Serratia marcescens]UMK48049.1 restriction endonuclease subunit S [Serratia marcescens]CAB5662838.1 Predicted nucleotidyltransferases [Serratia marcescens]